MANVIKLHKGLNINLKGKPAQEIFDVKQPDIYALVPMRWDRVFIWLTQPARSPPERA